MAKVERYTCPHCGKETTAKWFSLHHGDRCKKLKIKAPPSIDEINKEYTDLHNQFIDLIEKYHNNHIWFTERPSRWTSRDLVRHINALRKLTLKMKMNLATVRNDIRDNYNERKGKLTRK